MVTITEISNSEVVAPQQEFSGVVIVVEPDTRATYYRVEGQMEKENASMAHPSDVGVQEEKVDSSGTTALTQASGTSESAVTASTDPKQYSFMPGGIQFHDDFAGRWIRTTMVEWGLTQKAGALLTFFDMPSLALETNRRAGINVAFGQYLFSAPTIDVKLQSNATRFMGGTIIMAARYNDRSHVADYVRSAYQLLSMPHVILQASSENEGVLRVPFVNPLRMIPNRDTNIADALYYFTLYVGVLNPLVVGEGSSNSVTLQLYTNFNDTMFSVQRQFQPEFTPCSDSVHASRVNIQGQMMAAVEGTLSTIREVESLAEGIGALLKPGNCDRPTIMKDRTTINIQPTVDMSIGEGPIDLVSLRNKKSHLTPHPKELLPGAMEYSLDYIMRVKNAILTFPWEASFSRGIPLMVHDISPIHSLKVENEVLLPSISEVSANFMYHTGSYCLEFMFGSSLMHSGRLIILVAPDSSEIAPENWYSYPYVIYDLGQQQVIEFYVPNMCPTHLTPNFAVDNGQIVNIQSFGTVQVFVETPLKVLGAVSSTIYCTVLMRAAPDYRVYVPKENRLYLNTITQQVSLEGNMDVRTRVDQTLYALEPKEAVEHTIGESMSVHTVSRRFQHVVSFDYSKDNFTDSLNWVYLDLDLRPGAVFHNFEYGTRDFLGWLSQGMRFAKGSLRFIIHAPQCRMKVVHLPNEISLSNGRLVEIGKSFDSTTYLSTYGTQITSSVVNDTMTVEVPYYNNVSFLVNGFDPAARFASATNNWEHCKYSFGKLRVYFQNSGVTKRIDIYRAAGDDFSMYCYQGFPLRSASILDDKLGDYTNMLATIPKRSGRLFKVHRFYGSNDIIFGIRVAGSDKMVQGVYDATYLIDDNSAVDFRGSGSTSWSNDKGLVSNDTGSKTVVYSLINGAYTNVGAQNNNTGTSIDKFADGVGVRYATEPAPTDAKVTIKTNVAGLDIRYQGSESADSTVQTSDVAFNISLREGCINLRGNNGFDFLVKTVRNYFGKELFLEIRTTKDSEPIEVIAINDDTSIDISSIANTYVTVYDVRPVTEQVELEGNMEMPREEMYDSEGDEVQAPSNYTFAEAMQQLRREKLVPRYSKKVLEKKASLRKCVCSMEKKALLAKKLTVFTDATEVVPNIDIWQSLAGVTSSLNPLAQVNAAASSVSNAMSTLTSTASMIASSLEERIVSLVPSLAGKVMSFLNMLPNLYIMWFSQDWNVIGAAFMSVLISIGVLTVHNMGTLFGALIDLFKKGFSGMVGQAEDRASSILSYFNVMFPIVAGGLGFQQYASANRSRFVYLTFFRDLFGCANSVSSFIKNNLTCLSNFINWVCREKNPEVDAIAILQDKREEMKAWLERAIVITSGHNYEKVCASSSLQKELDLVYREAGTYLQLIQGRNVPNSNAFMNIYTKVAKLHHSIGQRVGRGRLTIEPISMRLVGPPGVGKSVVLSKIMTELLIEFGVVFDGPAIYTRNFTEYWNGYNDQPAVIYDDFLQISEPTVQAQALQEFFSICTCAEFNAVMPAIEDKDRMVNPELIGTIMNVIPHSLSGVTSLDAFKRRGDFTVKVEFDAPYVSRLTGIPQTQLTSPEHPGIPVELLDRFDHLKFTMVDRFNGAPIGPTMKYTQFIQRILPGAKALRDKRRRVAQRRAEDSYALSPSMWEQRLQQATLPPEVQETVETNLRSAGINANLTEVLAGREQLLLGEDGNVVGNCETCVELDTPPDIGTNYRTVIGPTSAPPEGRSCMCQGVGSYDYCLETGCWLIPSKPGTQTRTWYDWQVDAQFTPPRTLLHPNPQPPKFFDETKFRGDYYYLPMNRACSSLCQVTPENRAIRYMHAHAGDVYAKVPKTFMDLAMYAEQCVPGIEAKNILSPEMKERLLNNPEYTADMVVGLERRINEIGLTPAGMIKYNEWLNTFLPRERWFTTSTHGSRYMRFMTGCFEKVRDFCAYISSFNKFFRFIAVVGTIAFLLIAFNYVCDILGRIVAWLFPSCSWARLYAKNIIQYISLKIFARSICTLIGNVAKQDLKDGKKWKSDPSTYETIDRNATEIDGGEVPHEERFENAVEIQGNVGGTSSGDPKTRRMRASAKKVAGQILEPADDEYIHKYFKSRKIDLDKYFKNTAIDPEMNTVGFKRFFGNRKIAYSDIAEELAEYIAKAYDQVQKQVKVALVVSKEPMKIQSVRMLQYLSVLTNTMLVFVDDTTYMDYTVDVQEDGSRSYEMSQEDSNWLVKNDGKILMVSADSEMESRCVTIESTTDAQRFSKWLKLNPIVRGESEEDIQFEIIDADYILHDIEDRVVSTKEENKQKLAKEIENVVRFHTVFATVGDHLLHLKLFVPFGRYAIMPFHFTKALEKWMDEKITYRYFAKKGDSTSDHPGDVRSLYESVVRLNNLDLCFVKLPESVPILNNITGMFADQHYATTAFKKNARLVDGCDNTSQKMEVRYFDKVKCVQGQVNYDGISDILLLGYSYPYAAAGLCGAALVCNRSNKILGFHTTGKTDGSEGYAMVCVREIVQQLRHEYFPVVKAEPEVTDETEAVEVEGNCELIGTVSEKVSLKPLTKTQIKASPCSGLLIEPQRFPLVFTTPGEERSGQAQLVKALEVQCDPPDELEEEFLDAVEESLWEQMKYVMPPSMLQPKEVMSVDQAVLGLDGRAFFKPMNLNTSPGWPLCSQYPGSNKKSFLEVDYQKKQVILKDPLRNLYLKQHRQRKVGIVPFAVSADFAKDERRPPGKGIRLINGTPLQEYIDWRRYTAEFWVAFQEAGLGMGCAVGTNAEGTDWNNIAQYLLNNSQKIITGDYTAFGPRVPRQVIRRVMILCERWYQYFFRPTRTNTIVRKTLYEGIMFRPHIIFNTIIGTRGGIDSGNPWTAPLNSLCNKILMMYIWHDIFYHTMYRDLYYFHQATADVYYGDDLLISIREPFDEMYNNNTIREAFAKYRIKFTDAHKRTDGPDYESIDEASFLKRRFVLHPERMIYVAQLDESVVLDIVNWYREPCIDVPLKVAQDSVQICYFTSSYGKHYYDQVRKKLMAWFGKQGYALPLPTYDSMDARYDMIDLDWGEVLDGISFQKAFN